MYARVVCVGVESAWVAVLRELNRPLLFHAAPRLVQASHLVQQVHSMPNAAVELSHWTGLAHVDFKIVDKAWAHLAHSALTTLWLLSTTPTRSFTFSMHPALYEEGKYSEWDFYRISLSAKQCATWESSSPWVRLSCLYLPVAVWHISRGWVRAILDLDTMKVIFFAWFWSCDFCILASFLMETW